jgi:predicted HicB family RNase H-like nuclease
MPENKNSKAKIAANNRYNEKNYDRINIAVSKGKKAVIKAHAESIGESINGYINKAIDEKMERDGSKDNAAVE